MKVEHDEDLTSVHYLKSNPWPAIKQLPPYPSKCIQTPLTAHTSPTLLSFTCPPSKLLLQPPSVPILASRPSQRLPPFPTSSSTSPVPHPSLTLHSIPSPRFIFLLHLPSSLASPPTLYLLLVSCFTLCLPSLFLSSFHFTSILYHPLSLLCFPSFVTRCLPRSSLHSAFEFIPSLIFPSISLTLLFFFLPLPSLISPPRLL